MKRLLSLALIALVLTLAVVATPVEVNEADAASECEENEAQLFAEIVDSGTCGENLTWTLDDDGTLTISGVGSMDDSKFANPPWYSLRKSIRKIIICDGVTSIRSSAFEDCTSLVNITIPDSVTKIGYEAFTYCIALDYVKISAEIISIGEDAFYYCTNLYIDVNENNKNYSSLDGVLFNKNKTTLIQASDKCISAIYVVPDSVTSISSGAFCHCTALKNIILPEGISSLGYYSVFSNCTSLESINIPQSVTDIGYRPFFNCKKLYINVDENNENYSSINGVLFNKDKTLMIRGSDVCVSTNYIIPNSVTKIGDYSFEDCISLESIIIPKSVTEIGFSAFGDYSKLSDVYYYGTEAEWKSISIRANNVPLLYANIHFNYTPYTPGDLTSDDTVDIDDAIILFQHTMMPDIYPLDSYAGDLDFNNDGEVDIDDAILIFQHSMMPDIYPLD